MDTGTTALSLHQIQTSHIPVSTTAPFLTHATDKLKRQQTEGPSDVNTEANSDGVQIPPDKSSESGLSNTTLSQTSTTKTGSPALQSSEQTPQGCDLAKHSALSQDKDTRPDDNADHTNNDQHTFAEQIGGNEDQIAEESSIDPCQVTKESAKSTKVLHSSVIYILY